MVGLSLSLKHRVKSHIVITKGCGCVGLDAGWHWLEEEKTKDLQGSWSKCQFDSVRKITVGQKAKRGKPQSFPNNCSMCVKTRGSLSLW